MSRSLKNNLVNNFFSSANALIIFFFVDCLRTAATFIQNMDSTANPCEDFFQYMCGNFEQEHPMPDSSTSHDWYVFNY